MQTRYWLLAAASLYTFATLQAQTVVDATRIGQNNIVGTARYNAMAGAFGALGGDPTSMSDNPAGLGIYRGTSEFSITPNLAFSHTASDGSEKAKDKKADFSVSNLAYILSVKTPRCNRLVNYNVGIGLNHSARSNRRYSTVLDNPSGSFGGFLAATTNNFLYNEGKMFEQESWLTGDESWDDTNAPFLGLMAYDTWAVDDRTETIDGVKKNLGGVEGYNEKYTLQSYQRMSVREKHRNDECNISAAFNWGDTFYAGFTLRISDFNSTIVSTLQEDYDYNYNGDYLDYENGLETSGSGVGFNIGLLWKPLDQWRIGAAVHTPTWYQMRDVYYGAMNTNDNVDYWSETGTYDYDYRYYSPWEYQLSTAYIFGTRAILSLEWDVRDFDKMKYLADRDVYKDHQEAKRYFRLNNSAIKEFMKAQHTYKAGLEYRFNKSLSGRLGYSMTTSPYEDSFGEDNGTCLLENPDTAGNGIYYQTSTKPNYSILKDQQYFSGGIGWRGKMWYLDFTVSDQIVKEQVAMYPTTLDNYFDEVTYADHIDLTTSRLNYELTIGMKF